MWTLLIVLAILALLMSPLFEKLYEANRKREGLDERRERWEENLRSGKDWDEE